VRPSGWPTVGAVTPPARPTRRAVLGFAGAAAGSSLAACSDGAGHSPSASAASSPAGAVRSSSTPSSPPRAATSSPSTRPAGADITHGPRTRPAVALTFHGDGPESIVRDLVRVLHRAGARVTVLAIGRWLAAEPDVVRMLRDAGHELGNHTWSHRTMPRLPAAQIRSEIDRAAAELDTLTGSPGRWFRPSGTPYSTAAIRAAAVAAGYGACLGYDVDPLDYTDPGPAAIVRSFTRQVRPGSVVSLHLGHAGTVAALPTILTGLRERGLAAVTATDLLGA
jgi:peptidoglycan/xylan/chitin deacetylase (PgdA/CDA1 family)